MGVERFKSTTSGLSVSTLTLVAGVVGVYPCSGDGCGGDGDYILRRSVLRVSGQDDSAWVRVCRSCGDSAFASSKVVAAFDSPGKPEQLAMF